MRKSTRICRICGKEYEACKPAFTSDEYRWQDVACCMEHGMEYFIRIAESRNEPVDEQRVESPKASKPKVEVKVKPDDEKADGKEDKIAAKKKQKD